MKGMSVKTAAINESYLFRMFRNFDAFVIIWNTQLYSNTR
jgi:hypothetical protein